MKAPGRLADEVADQIGQGCFGSIEAFDHRRDDTVPLEDIDIKRVAGMRCQHRQECELGAAIAFPERVDRVEFGQEVGHFRGEGCAVELVEPVGVAQLGKTLLQLALDMFRVAEPIAAFADADGADLACPRVNVLEQMMVDGQEMGGVKISGRQRLVEPRKGQCQLGFVEVSLVLKECPDSIADRIGLRRPIPATFFCGSVP